MQSAESQASFWNRVRDYLTQPGPPSAPQPPAVNHGAWSESEQQEQQDQNGWARKAEQTKISDSLGTVHDLGLRVFNETQSYSDRPDENEPLEVAREKLAHVILNGDQKWGADRQRRASTAEAIEPSADTLKGAVLDAYNSSMKAAREAYLSEKDPTNGAVYLNQRGNPGRGNLVYPKGDPRGVPLATQSGPYNNSFPNKQMPSRTAWLNTYWEK